MATTKLRSMRNLFFILSGILVALIAALGHWVSSGFYWAYLVVLPIVVIGLHNAFQTKKAILRNYPIIGMLRYFFEEIRPEIQQYFVENDTDGAPFLANFDRSSTSEPNGSSTPSRSVHSAISTCREQNGRNTRLPQNTSIQRRCV